MRFGIHVPTSGGLKKAAQTAVQLGCETIQIFTSNPTGWKVANLDPKAAAEFVSITHDHDIRPIFVHIPYLVSPAALNPTTLERSRLLLAATLERAEAVGASHVVMHLGSHLGAGVEAGIARMAETVASALEMAQNPVVLLLENSPGSRNELGSSFEEIAAIWAHLEPFSQRLGVCLDTAHMWSAGYDLSSAAGVKATMDDFEAKVGMKHLQLIHANDSKAKFNSGNDLHQPPGEGLMGLETFRALVQEPRLEEMPLIIEIPLESPDLDRLRIERLKGLRPA